MPLVPGYICQIHFALNKGTIRFVGIDYLLSDISQAIMTEIAKFCVTCLLHSERLVIFIQVLKWKMSSHNFLLFSRSYYFICTYLFFQLYTAFTSPLAVLLLAVLFYMNIILACCHNKFGLIDPISIHDSCEKLNFITDMNSTVVYFYVCPFFLLY